MPPADGGGTAGELDLAFVQVAPGALHGAQPAGVLGGL